MGKIDAVLNKLSPYLIGIRYLEGTVLVDVVFKEGWSVPTEKNITTIKGEDGVNYFMIFSEVEGIELDDLLKYVEKVIKVNLEREKKHELLRKKVGVLKEIFQKNSLQKLMTLKFSFTDGELVPKIDEFDLTIEPVNEEITEEPIVEEIYEEVEKPIEEPAKSNQLPTPIGQYLDENGKPIEMTKEDIEFQEEEERAERNRLIIEAKKKEKNINNISKRVELPTKKSKLGMVNIPSSNSDCECGEDDACEKCIDLKHC